MQLGLNLKLFLLVYWFHKRKPRKSCVVLCGSIFAVCFFILHYWCLFWFYYHCWVKNWETQIKHVVLKIKAHPIQFTAHKNRISWVYCGFSYKKRKIQTHNKLTLKVMTIKHTKQSLRRLILAAGIYTAAASVHVLIKKKNGKKIINKLLTFFKKTNL